tara:strand:- start:1313 stop:2071 length:759 start_codon:yes stop_codon:yes gene_type:complete
MSKFKYLRISKNKKIRYLLNSTSGDIYLLFLHGFKSDLEGDKPKTLFKFCKKNKIGFLALEYSGHGKSYGKFEEGTITTWTKDTKKIINRKIINKKLIVIGSSMGGWIGLNLLKSYKKNILAFIGIAPAPEFLDRLMWNKFTTKIKRQMIQDKFHKFSHGGYEYNISYNLIKDGRKNKIFNKNYSNKIFLTILHGQKDDVVPISISRKILKIFTKAKKKLIIIKRGDHSLSSKNNLKKIINEINSIYKKLNP